MNLRVDSHPQLLIVLAQVKLRLDSQIGSTTCTGAGEESVLCLEILAYPSHHITIRQENVRCIMGYIIHLTIILDAIFSTISDDVSQDNVQLIIDLCERMKDRIHSGIRGFVTEVFDIGSSARKQDLILERIIDLIQGFCVPDTVIG